MEFPAAVRVASGSLSLILALVTGFPSAIVIIAMVKNPLHLTQKPVERIVLFMVALFFLAATILPYFGVTEILRGANGEETAESFPTFVSVVVDFLIGGKLLLFLLFNIERFAAYAYPHLHRSRFTKRSTTLLCVLVVALSFLFSLLAVTGIHERIYDGVFIHLFASCSWLALAAITGLTYRKIKYRKTRVLPGDVAIQDRLPHLRERAEMERVRYALGAQKYLLQVAIWFFPFMLSILTWYIVKFINTVNNDLLETNAGFFWQRFCVPLAFITDPCLPLFMIFNEYARTVRTIFCTK